MNRLSKSIMQKTEKKKIQKQESIPHYICTLPSFPPIVLYSPFYFFTIKSGSALFVYLVPVSESGKDEAIVRAHHV